MQKTRDKTEPIGETVRVFVAIELPQTVADTLAAVIDELRRASIAELRLMRPEGVHLTLKFLGDVEPDRLKAIEAAVGRVAEAHACFSLGLGEPGAFPGGADARVLWIDLRGDLEPLQALQRDVEESLEALGFGRDRREFSPHLTLARLRDRASKAERRRAVEALASINIDSRYAIDVRTISLMQSTLHPDGAAYKRLASIPLGRGNSA